MFCLFLSKKVFKNQFFFFQKMSCANSFNFPVLCLKLISFFFRPFLQTKTAKHTIKFLFFFNPLFSVQNHDRNWRWAARRRRAERAPRRRTFRRAQKIVQNFQHSEEAISSRIGESAHCRNKFGRRTGRLRVSRPGRLSSWNRIDQLFYKRGGD